MAKNMIYFDQLAEMADKACIEADALYTIIHDFKWDDLPGRLEEIHRIESDGDEIMHNFAQNLAKEFLPPLDREDLFSIAQELDNVIDCVEDVLIQIYMYNAKEMKPETLEFADIVKKCCGKLKDMMLDFKNYKKPDKIHQLMIEINQLEEESDLLYVNTVHRLFSESDNTLEKFVWAKIYERFENCCDACEHVANLTENLAVKNI
jgi:predicted phosphate transport protein (TIGR00153 family)